MRVRFLRQDSTGTVPTDRLTVDLDGERHEIEVASTGTAMVPKEVGEHLINSDDYAVGPYDGGDDDGDGEDSDDAADDGGETDSDSDSESDSESDSGSEDVENADSSALDADADADAGDDDD